MVTQNKVVMVGLGRMNRKLRKLERKGWKVKSTTATGFPGTIWVTLEREIPGRHRQDPFGPQQNT